MDLKKLLRNNVQFALTVVFIAVLLAATALFIVILQILNIKPSSLSIILSALIIVTITTVVGLYFIRMVQKEIVKLERYVHQGLHAGSVPPPRVIKWRSMNAIATEIYDLVNNNSTSPLSAPFSSAEIEQAEKDKLRSRQVLLNNLNHEIKTPIGIIQGYVDTLLEHDEQITPDMRRRFLKKCLDTTQRLQNMAFSLSVISRLENGREAIIMDEVNLTECINNVFEDLQPIIEKSGMKASHNLPNKFMVHSNPTLIYNIFSNLVKNAVFYSGGSKIIVELLDDGSLSFRDNGKGVDENFLPKIFERFYRLDTDRNRNLSSSGLGLSIVKEAVSLHGYSINAKNHPEGGLQFIFRL